MGILRKIGEKIGIIKPQPQPAPAPVSSPPFSNFPKVPSSSPLAPGGALNKNNNLKSVDYTNSANIRSSGGGGGGGSGTLPTSQLPTSQLPTSQLPQTTQQSTNLNIIGKDIPAPLPQSFQTAIQRAEMQKQSIYEPTLYEKAKANVVGAYRKVTGAEQREKVVQEQTRQLQAGEITGGFTQGGSGTIVTERVTQQFTVPELLKMEAKGAVSSQAVENELIRREQEKYGKNANIAIDGFVSEIKRQSSNVLNSELQKSESNIAQVRNDLIVQLQERRITEAKANKILDDAVKIENQKLETFTNELNTQNNELLKSKYEGWVNTRGKSLEKESYIYLDKISDKIKFRKVLTFLPLVVGAGVAVGAGLGVVAGTGAVGSAVVQTAGIGAGAVASVQTGKYIGQSYAQGTLTGTKLANVFIPFVAFGVGSGIGGSLVAGAKVNPEQLKGAIDRATYSTKIIKGSVKEIDIKKLDLLGGENAKAQLIGELKAGSSIKEVEVKIRGINKIDNRIINKGLPTRNIKFVEVVDRFGNVVRRVAIGKVEVRKGVYKFNEEVLSIGSGTTTDGITTIESMTYTGKSGKPFTSVTKTAERITSQTKQITPSQRAVYGRQVTAEAGKVVATKGKPIKYSDIEDVALSNYKKLTRTSKFGEVQELNKLKIDLYKQDKTILAGAEQTYAIKAGTSISNKIPQQVDAIIKPSKAFRQIKEPPKTDFTQNYAKQQQTFKATIDKATKSYPSYVSGEGGAGSESIYGFDAKSMFKSDVMTIPEADLSSAIKSSLKSSADVFGKVKPIRTTAQPTQQMKQLEFDILTDLKVKPFSAGDVVVKPIIDLRKKNIDKILTTPIGTTGINFNDLNKQLQTPVQNLNYKQLQKQLQQPKLQQKLIQTPSYNFPFTPFPIIPIINVPKFPVSGGQGAGSKQFKKFMPVKTRVKPKYTASLGAAFFQAKPTKVTKAQYEKLNKTLFSGLEARPVLQIVSDEELKKELKKIKKVKF